MLKKMLISKIVVCVSGLKIFVETLFVASGDGRRVSK